MNTPLKPEKAYAEYDWNTPEADEYWNQVGGREPSDGWRSISEERNEPVHGQLYGTDTIVEGWEDEETYDERKDVW